MSFDKLPQELFTEICTRLPIKTIVHVGCVCKSWDALIKNPNFITAHINRTIADKKTRLRLLRYHSQHDEEENISIRCDNETFDECMTFGSSYDFIYRICHFRIVGSCKGLICLSDDLDSNTSVLVVWNPAIRKTLRVQMPPRINTLHDFVVGFGFNSWTNDFKIVRIVYFWDFDMNVFRLPAEVQVYEISTGLWRGSSAVVPPYKLIPRRHSSHVFVKGASHWIALEKGKEQFRYLILSFDMGSEVFREMMLPASVSNVPKLNMSISLLGKFLSLFHYDGALSDTSKRCSIWVMKEYGVVESWTKLFTLEGALNKVLGFRKSGKVLVAKSNRELVSFDPKSKQEVNLGICSSKDSFHLDTYMESLVFLDRKDQDSLNETYWLHNHFKEEYIRRKIQEETSVKNAEGNKEK